MNPGEPAPRQVAETVMRVLVVLAVMAMVGTSLAESVDARRIAANGVSIAERVENQRLLCNLGGGAFSATNTAFGSTITTCTGGDGGAGTCVNTAQSTDCHSPLTGPEEGVSTLPSDGVFDEPPGPLPGIDEDGSAGAHGQPATVHADRDDQHAEKGKGKKKGKGKHKRGRGGK